jgi:hypothetical protein
MVYDPKVFDTLKGILGLCREWLDTEDDQVFIDGLNTVANKHQCHLKILEAVEPFDLLTGLKGAKKRSRSRQGAETQFHDWFDGFKTLRMIHQLRDIAFGEIPILAAVKQSSFLSQIAAEDRESILKEIRDL